jgi:multisubunit Na+/H+ antiporter MnhF subunit
MVPGLLAYAGSVALGRVLFPDVSWLQLAGLALLVLALVFISGFIVSRFANRNANPS